MPTAPADDQQSVRDHSSQAQCDGFMKFENPHFEGSVNNNKGFPYCGRLEFLDFPDFQIS